MRTFCTVLALVVALAAGPALAECEFEGTDSDSFNLGGPGVIDPYGGDFTAEKSIGIDASCDVVYLEIDFGGTGARTLDHTASNDTIAFGLSVTNGSLSDAMGHSRWRVLASADTIDLSFEIDLDDGTAPRSGTYERVLTLSLYDEPSGGKRLGGPFEAEVSIAVEQTMTISLNGMVSDYSLDLGPLVPGTDATNSDVRLLAKSNDPYRVTFESANDWRIVQDAADGKYEIPYTLTFAGKRMDAKADSVDGLDATDGSGIGRNLFIVARPDGNLRAGAYIDEVTIVISGE